MSFKKKKASGKRLKLCGFVEVNDNEKGKKRIAS